jgi:hypothetical protein
MSEAPNSQNPEPPPPEPPAPPRADSKLDWRLVAVIAMAVLFLIAIYANKKYSKPATEPAPSNEPAPGAAARPSGPPPSLKEIYARMLRVHELEIQGEMFKEGGRTLLLAVPAAPSSAKEGQPPDKIVPGILFDVTKLADGVRPEMLQRRIAYGPNQALFMDTFPSLGMDEELKMVVTPAADVTMNVVADKQPVIGVKVAAEARAYPVKFMNYHDVINDTLGGEPIAVVWSASVNAPSAVYRDQFTFGSAGLVFQGAIVMYSKDATPAADGKKIEEFSLWSPTMRLCIAGERAGARLRPLQADLVSWQTWKTLNPQTTVLAGTKPVQPFNYDATLAVPPDYINPQNPMLLHPVYGVDVEKSPLPLKVGVFGITDSQGKAAKAYLPMFLREKTGPFEDAVGGRKLTLEFNPDTMILSAKDAEGKPVLTEAMWWIAWLGAHPNTEVWQEDRIRAIRTGQTASAPAGTTAPATTAAPAAPAPAAASAPSDTVR